MLSLCKYVWIMTMLLKQIHCMHRPKADNIVFVKNIISPCNLHRKHVYTETRKMPIPLIKMISKTLKVVSLGSYGVFISV